MKTHIKDTTFKASFVRHVIQLFVSINFFKEHSCTDYHIYLSRIYLKPKSMYNFLSHVWRSFRNSLDTVAHFNTVHPVKLQWNVWWLKRCHRLANTSLRLHLCRCNRLPGYSRHVIRTQDWRIPFQEKLEISLEHACFPILVTPAAFSNWDEERIFASSNIPSTWSLVKVSFLKFADE